MGNLASAVLIRAQRISLFLVKPAFSFETRTSRWNFLERFAPSCVIRSWLEDWGKKVSSASMGILLRTIFVGDSRKRSGVFCDDRRWLFLRTLCPCGEERFGDCT